MKFLLIFLFVGTNILFSQNTTKDFIHSKEIDINNLKITFNNIGSLDGFRNRQVNGCGTWRKLNSEYGNLILYDQGFWVIGKIDEKIHFSLSEWANLYAAGPIINNQPAMKVAPQDSLKYRVYKINRGDSDADTDYAQWPFQFGAPADKFGKPEMHGDQMLWTVFNGLDTTATNRYKNGTSFKKYLLPFPVEVQQLVYAHKGNWWDEKDILSNIVFMEWTVINKSNRQIDSTYLGLWTDIDFNGTNNPPGVDSTLQLGFCRDLESIHMKAPYHPAVGYQLLYGPKIYSTNSLAIFKGKKIDNFKNLSLASFHPVTDEYYRSGITDPVFTVKEIWNIARGLDTKGYRIINPYTNEVTRFPYSGDPVTKSGWYCGDPTGSEAGFSMFVGPFNLAANDTQWVMMAVFPALGKDSYESLKLLRRKGAIIKSLTYETLAFSSDRIPIDSSESSIIPTNFEVSDNFPNPFNSTTRFRIALSEAGLIKAELYNLLGQSSGILYNQFHEIGINYIALDINEKPSGVYIVRISSGNSVYNKKILLLK